jgi:hypothetical protein
MHLEALTYSTAVLFETLMAMLKSHRKAPVYRDRPPGNRWGAGDFETWLREPCRPCTAQARRDGKGVVMSSAYRMNGTGETSPPCATPACVTRRVDAADWKDVQNLRWSLYDGMVFSRWDGKFRIVSLYRWPLDHTVSKALATSRKTESVCHLSTNYLLTLSTRLASCSLVLCLGRIA